MAEQEGKGKRPPHEVILEKIINEYQAINKTYEICKHVISGTALYCLKQLCDILDKIIIPDKEITKIITELDSLAVDSKEIGYEVIEKLVRQLQASSE